MRKTHMDYSVFCEQMFEQWKTEQLAMPNGFLPDYSPEPYLTFGHRSLPDIDGPTLVFLTTNPGRGMERQTRESAGDRTYADFQSHLVESLYDTRGFTGSAANRIGKMRRIAEGLFQTSRFVQCEVVPFHSESLPNKARVDAQIELEDSDSLMNRYLEVLSRFLSHHHVVALDATNRLKEPTRVWQGWIKRKASLFGFQVEGAGEPFVKRSAKGNDSTHLYHYRDRGLLRAYYLTQGSNNFGADVAGIVDALKSS